MGTVTGDEPFKHKAFLFLKINGNWERAILANHSSAPPPIAVPQSLPKAPASTSPPTTGAEASEDDVARTLRVLTQDSPDATEVIPPAGEWWKSTDKWNPTDPVAAAEMAEIERLKAELARQREVTQQKLDALRARKPGKRTSSAAVAPTSPRKRRLAERIRERGDNYRVQA